MQFLGISSELFTTLLLSLGGAIVLLYMVKLRRRRIEVPYSVIWQKILLDRKARSLWQRLKRFASLLIQLLILLLLIVALRDPRPEGEPTQGRHIILVMDTSASMASLDLPGGRDRMEGAREEALALFDSLGPHDNIMVVRMDGHVRPLTPFVRPTALIRDMIERLDVSATGTDLVGTLRFAASSLENRTRPELILISDGAYPAEIASDAAEIALPQNAELTFIQVGQAGGNAAITAFNVRRYPANRLNYEVYVQLQSYFDEPVTIELSVAAGGRIVERMLVELPPHGTEVRVYPNLATGGSRLEARITLVAGDANDVFPLDDVAYAMLPEATRTRVLLVTADNLFVEAPFILNQNIDLSRIAPEAYVSSEGYDLTIFNSTTPPIPETGNLLYIHPTGPYSPWASDREIADPIIDRPNFDSGHPLMRWIHSFRDLNIQRALELDLSSDDRRIAWSIAGDAMIVAREEEGRRFAATAFKIEESDFALRLEYPLFVLNAIDWLTGEDADLIEGFSTGRAWRIYTQRSDGETGWIVPPNGEPEAVQLIDGYITFYPEHPGFYELHWGEDLDRSAAPDRVLAANLSDPVESAIGPAQEPAFEPAPDVEQSQASVLPLNREPWFYLVLLAIALLIVEWVTFNRRVTV
jgi:hypothetical protein